MLNRRLLLTSVAALTLATPALAQDWKARYPELVLAVIPEENATGTTDRWTPFVAYLTRELGVKVTLRIANDYAAIIEGQRSGNIHIAYYGPASYARAYTIGVKTEPFAIDINKDGSKEGSRGYYSVFYVKKDSPYQKIEDLKGKNLGLVDANSTSGNNVPRFALNEMKIDPETYFNKVVYTGSHENAILALQQGTVDVAANWWNNENESLLMRMDRKGMAKYSDFRIIYKSPMIVNSALAYLSDLPADLKTKIADAVLNMHERDKAAFDKVNDGQRLPYQATTHKDYEPVVELIKFVDTLRKKRTGS